MGIKLTNNANATLAAGINSSATSITLTSGQGARFPTLTASDYFYATLIDTSNNLEIVKCTARSTDVLTVVRAQESTTARAYSTGDRIEIRITAQTFVDATTIYDIATTSTGYFSLPSGTTGQRPASPAGNMIRHNTTTGYVELYDVVAAQWVGIGAFAATGGTVTTSGGYTIHTFTSSGNFQVLSGSKTVEYLIVAGGGGGGSDLAGGGGAGGLLSGTTSVTPTNYTITVGSGGIAALSVRGNSRGGSGVNSSAFSLTSIGGGGGAGYWNGVSGANIGSNGGSGGGGGAADAFPGGVGGTGTAGQGFDGGRAGGAGGYPGGGGGGASVAGGNSGESSVGGTGGNGVSNSISGSSVFYAGGGGGANYSSTSGFSSGGAGGSGGGGNGGYNVGTDAAPRGIPGTPNTGGGGGGSSWNGSIPVGGYGQGGSGIVIVRYVA